jgi:hypothetical protein
MVSDLLCHGQCAVAHGADRDDLPACRPLERIWLAATTGACAGALALQQRIQHLCLADRLALSGFSDPGLLRSGGAHDGKNHPNGGDGRKGGMIIVRSFRQSLVGEHLLHSDPFQHSGAPCVAGDNPTIDPAPP